MSAMEAFALDIGNHELMTFHAVLLGEASSQRDKHDHLGEYVASNQRCSACRWQEVKLFWLDAGNGTFRIYTCGRSVIPGERDFAKVRDTKSAFEIVELLTVRNGTKSFLPVPAARALAQAAQYNDDIREAYVNRAVV